jgi:UDPglucose 6-dehydrogenase
MAEVNGLHPQLLRAVMEINRDQRRQVIVKLRNMLGSLRDATIGLLGLAFKPNTDDIREAASIDIVHLLTNEGAHLRAYDPVAMEAARRVLEGVALCADPYELARDADALILVTEWNEFKQLDLPRLAGLMRRRVFIDGRNVYDPKMMQELGFEYSGVGRAAQPAVGAAAQPAVGAGANDAPHVPNPEGGIRGSWDNPPNGG